MEYFVSFAWSDGINSGFASAAISMEQPIRNFSDIETIKDIIINDTQYDSVVVLNYIRFPGAEEEGTNL